MGFWAPMKCSVSTSPHVYSLECPNTACLASLFRKWNFEKAVVMSLVRVQQQSDLTFPKSRPMLFSLNMKSILENNKLLPTQQACDLHHKPMLPLGLMSLWYWRLYRTERKLEGTLLLAPGTGPLVSCRQGTKYVNIILPWRKARLSVCDSQPSVLHSCQQLSLGRARMGPLAPSGIIPGVEEQQILKETGAKPTEIQRRTWSHIWKLHLLNGSWASLLLISALEK